MEEIVVAVMDRRGVKPQREAHPKTKAEKITSFRNQFIAEFVSGSPTYVAIIDEALGGKGIKSVTAAQWGAYLKTCKKGLPTGKLRTVYNEVGNLFNNAGFRTRAEKATSAKAEESAADEKPEASPDQEKPETMDAARLVAIMEAGGVTPDVAYNAVRQYLLAKGVDIVSLIDDDSLLAEADSRLMAGSKVPDCVAVAAA